MIETIDNFLNKITMYRLILYYLLGLWVIALLYSALGILNYSVPGLVFSLVYLIAICWLLNKIFAWAYDAPTNIESLYITALILVLIISPASAGTYGSFLSLATWAAVWAMVSKYLFAIKRKHLFNPAAFGVAMTALVLNQAAVWWVAGNLALLPFVLVGGLLVVRKLRRFDLVLSFFAAALLASFFYYTFWVSEDILTILNKIIIHSSLLFFAFVILTEPLTTPPTRPLRLWYGALVGLLFPPFVHLGDFYSTPELSILVGNIFSYLVSSKEKLLLKLKEKIQIAPDTYDFVFQNDRALAFQPGQYLEWTLDHPRSDSRGNRRYFTIASSPSERDLRLGVKFYPESSSFKEALFNLPHGGAIVGAQLAGDFTLPKDKKKKLVFIAGGIGVTPFRSMIKYLLDNHEKRNIIILFSNKTESDILYKDLFDLARQELGLKVIYTLTDLKNVSTAWAGERGSITEEMIKREIPDYQERTFYVSGPRGMVVTFDDLLRKMGVTRPQIKSDFFPGFA